MVPTANSKQPTANPWLTHYIYNEHIYLSMEEGGEYLTIEVLATFFFSDKAPLVHTIEPPLYDSPRASLQSGSACHKSDRRYTSRSYCLTTRRSVPDRRTT